MKHGWTFVFAALSAGCSPPGSPNESDSTTDASSSSDATGSSQSASGSLGSEPSSSSGPSSSSSSSDPGDTTQSSSPTTDFESSSSGSPDPLAGVFARGRFTIPAGATVQEFSFTAQTEFNPGLLDGRTLLVAVTDLSHPERDQFVLCPGSHPLDGCATVDYGAFGMTHDNRITLDGMDGPIELHLFKDRSVQAEAEPLPENE